MSSIHYVYAADHLSAYVPGDHSGQTVCHWVPPKLRSRARYLTRHQRHKSEALAQFMSILDSLEKRREQS